MSAHDITASRRTHDSRIENSNGGIQTERFVDTSVQVFHLRHSFESDLFFRLELRAYLFGQSLHDVRVGQDVVHATGDSGR